MPGLILATAGLVALAHEAPGQQLAESHAEPETERSPRVDGRDPDASAFELEHSEVRFSIRPYAWLTSFSGTLGARGVVTDVDKSFAEIWKDSDTVFGVMGVVDLSYERLVFQFNGAYTKAEISEERGRARSGPLGGSAEVAAGVDTELQVSWFEGYAGYRLVDSRWGEADRYGLAFDIFGGGRYTSVELDLDVTADAAITLPGGEALTAGRRREISGSEEWVEPFVGLGSALTIDQRWLLIVRGDVGGFGAGHSEFAWQALGAVGYRWKLEGWSVGVFAGYRALAQDYEKGNFEWDGITHGPLLGLGM